MKKTALLAAAITVGSVITIFAGSDTDVRTPRVTMSPAAVPEMINYQGVLTDDTGTPIDVTVSMTFTIYDAETGGNDLWTETHGFVTTFGGFFDVLLGSSTPIPSSVFESSDRWLGVSVGGDPEMSPRQQIVSSAYSYWAGYADESAYADNAGEADAVSWDNISDMPAGFADGTDDEGAGGGVECSDCDDRFVNEADLDHLDAADGDPANALFVDDLGNVGIGTIVPQASGTNRYLHLKSGSAGYAFYVADAEASNSGITFLNSGTSKGCIYWNNDENFLGFTSGHCSGFEDMVIRNNGNVGIGTDSPSEILEVHGNVKVRDDLYVSGNVGIGTMNPQNMLEVSGRTVIGSDSKGIRMRADGSLVDIESLGSNLGINFGSGKDTYLNVSSGDVGIGTLSPTEKLEVDGNVKVTEDLLVDSDVKAGNSLIVQSYGVDNRFYGAAGNGIIGPVSNHGLKLITNNDTQMYIGTNGNVGIGTESPAGKLDINAQEAIYIQGNSIVSHGGNHTWFKANGGNIYFQPTNGQTKMVIGSSGDVGIGTESPAGKLDVNGSIYQRGGLLHADYVFEPDYDLETIEEHAEYMWKNKHLKAIPKARVDENGLEIVEVGAHRKGIVEELEMAHIYIQQLNETMKKQQSQIEMLKAEIADLKGKGE